MPKSLHFALPLTCTLVIRKNGIIDGVGNTRGATLWKDISQISAGQYHVVGLKSDGTLIAGGSNL